MTSAPAQTVGSVMPAADGAPVQPNSLWRAWTEGRAQVAAFRTARSALATLLDQRGVKRVWLPAFICGEAASAVGAREIVWVPTDAGLGLAPAAYETVRSGDAVLAVDYFGRSPDAAFRALAAARPDVLWIEDRAQALAPDAAAWGEVLLYSPRKLVGVADGGLLIGDTTLPVPSGEVVDEAALWAAEDARAQDRQGLDPASWFPLFRGREAAFAIDRLPISPRSRDALERVDFGAAVAHRRANYRQLLEGLGDYALWPGVQPDFAPLAFPVRVAERDAVVARLGERGVFCARHWSALPCPREGFDAAWTLAGDILSIPCDQRYGAADMARVAEAVKAVAVPI